MRISDVMMPAAVQMTLDDIGWFWGRDERSQGEPSRTGIPRKHVLEDYIVVNEIGKAVNQKINTLFVIGEWDRHNILRNVSHSSKFGKDWDSSKWLDLNEAEKIRDYLNSAEYIELGFHGLLHDMWDDDGSPLDTSEFYPPKDFIKGNPIVQAPESMVREHMDAFFEIYNDWGFKQEIKTAAIPGGAWGGWKTDEMPKILHDYGIKYWHNLGIPGCFVRAGVIINPKSIILCPWETYDLNPLKQPLYDPETAGIIMGHWPNVLRFDPDLNLERIEAWKEYYERESQVFGLIISRDAEFAHYQQMHRAFSEMSEENGMIKIDLTKVDEISPMKKTMPIYVSIKNGNEPIECIGGKISLYETKKAFKNYKIDRTEESIIYIK